MEPIIFRFLLVPSFKNEIINIDFLCHKRLSNQAPLHSNFLDVTHDIIFLIKNLKIFFSFYNKH